MSSVELLRAEVCVRVVSGEFTISQAASRLGLSYRHTKRLMRRYRRRGAEGLVHQGVGRKSNRSRPLAEIRTRALDLIRAHYSGPPDERFGPTLAAEHLESEHGLKVCSETLRLWMLEDGLWSPSRRRKPYRQRRERCAHFGEMVQADGSFHYWLEDRGPKGCLITFIDDSRSESMARFADTESTSSVTEVFEQWIVTHGVPRSLYVDGGGAFGLRQLTGQFARMCTELGVELIHARSPQAKGRVERCHGTHQDRLIKKMRLAGISNYQDANEFLKDYLAEHNRRFSVRSLEDEDFHLPLSGSIDLSRVFSMHSERVVSLDSVVCYDRRRFQLARTERSRAGQKVKVEKSKSGNIRIFHSGLELEWTEITSKPKNKMNGEESERAGDHNSVRRRPGDNHPWRYPNYNRATAGTLKANRLAELHTTHKDVLKQIPKP
jgi:transposase